MKTLKSWQQSNLDFDEYFYKPCQVNKDVIDDLGYYVGYICDYDNKITQINEAYDSNQNGCLRYTTFIESDDLFYYVGYFVDCSENNILSSIQDVLKNKKFS